MRNPSSSYKAPKGGTPKPISFRTRLGFPRHRLHAAVLSWTIQSLWREGTIRSGYTRNQRKSRNPWNTKPIPQSHLLLLTTFFQPLYFHRRNRTTTNPNKVHKSAKIASKTPEPSIEQYHKPTLTLDLPLVHIGSCSFKLNYQPAAVPVWHYLLSNNPLVFAYSQWASTIYECANGKTWTR